jgi:hypothetical protein
MSAFLACFGLPRFLFSAIGSSFAAGGGSADLSRIQWRRTRIKTGEAWKKNLI